MAGGHKSPPMSTKGSQMKIQAHLFHWAFRSFPSQQPRTSIFTSCACPRRKPPNRPGPNLWGGPGCSKSICSLRFPLGCQPKSAETEVSLCCSLALVPGAIFFSCYLAGLILAPTIFREPSRSAHTLEAYTSACPKNSLGFSWFPTKCQPTNILRNTRTIHGLVHSAFDFDRSRQCMSKRFASALQHKLIGCLMFKKSHVP